MAHKLPDLPFSRNALEPLISKETIDFHYDKHHRGYLNQLNSLIKNTPFEHLSLTETMMRSNGAIFNNAAQLWNHNFYWQSLAPQGSAPSGELLHAIEKNFSSLEHLTDEFKKAALALFGSGWAWLVVDLENNLSIDTTFNADNPVLRGKIPLLAIDVWEHAYYLDYKNERARYLDSFCNILNWKFAEETLKTYGPGSLLLNRPELIA
jgi:Fe-Mn family superoxide dismutase